MAKQNEVLRNEMVSALASNVVRVEDVAPDVPDYPPCDVCGKEFEGKLRCSKCQCAFYCGHECQRADWKKNHKKDCAAMAQSCKYAAYAFVNAVTVFVDLSIDLNDTVAMINTDDITRKNLMHALEKVLDYDLWQGLDNAGAYKYAIGIDINGAIESLLKEDIQNIEKRYENVIRMSFTEMWTVCPGIFRGIDVYRIKRYVHSSPTAFETWLQSSFHIMHIFRRAARNNDLFLKIQSTARNIMTAWIRVFTSHKASKAVLLGSSKVADEAATDRAKWIIQHVSKIIHKFPEGSSEITIVEEEFYTFTAMIQLRVQELEIDVGDFGKVLGLRGYNYRFSYYGVGIPLAVAIIAKGQALTALETDEAIKKHTQSVKSRRTRSSHGMGGSTASGSVRSGGGKKKSKKRGKNGRRN